MGRIGQRRNEKTPAKARVSGAQRQNRTADTGIFNPCAHVANAAKALGEPPARRAHSATCWPVACAAALLTGCADLPPLPDEPAPPPVVPLGDAPYAAPESVTLLEQAESDPLAPAAERGPVGGWAGAWCLGDQRLELYPAGLAVGLRPGSRVEGVAWLEGGRVLAVEWHVGAAAWVDRRQVWSDDGRMVLSAWSSAVVFERC